MRRRYLTSLRLIANLIVTDYISVQWIYHAYWVILLIFTKYNISLFFLWMVSLFYLKYLFLQNILRIFPSSGHYYFFLLYFYLRLNFHLWVWIIIIFYFQTVRQLKFRLLLIIFKLYFILLQNIAFFLFNIFQMKIIFYLMLLILFDLWWLIIVWIRIAGDLVQARVLINTLWALRAVLNFNMSI